MEYPNSPFIISGLIILPSMSISLGSSEMITMLDSKDSYSNSIPRVMAVNDLSSPERLISRVFDLNLFTNLFTFENDSTLCFPFGRITLPLK